ncbi:MAG: hypothetical protein GY749_08080 [Desulfobacteraceae bacterium]|nr:hypothetical protein [Desulfobacteraceae bacterium]
MIIFDLAKSPEEAVKLLKAKGYKISFDWREVWKQANQNSFTVAKAMSEDILEDILEMLGAAAKDGIMFEQFLTELEPKLRAKGWWGKQLVTDPATGKQKMAWLGTPWRLKTIYRTNLQVIHGCGRYKGMTAPSGRNFRPFWQYIAVMDGNTRPSHRALHGKIFRADDPFWTYNYPPNGWG